jgi:hypothetical protein
MKIVLYTLSIVLTGLFALSISGCGDEPLTTGMDTVVDIVTEPPIKEPITSPTQPVTPQPTDPVQQQTGFIVMSIEPTRIASPSIGRQLTVDIRISNLTRSFTGYRIGVDFDPTAFRFVKAQPRADTHRNNNTLEVIPSVSNVNTNTDGTHRVNLEAETKGGEAFAQNGTLATVTFEVVAVKSSTIQLNDVDIYYLFTGRQGNINVVNVPISLQTATVDGEIYVP